MQAVRVYGGNAGRNQMNKLNFALSIGLLAVVLAPYWWEDFPSMAVLYALMTASSVLYGLGCLRGPGNAYLWQQRKVPEYFFISAVASQTAHKICRQNKEKQEQT